MVIVMGSLIRDQVVIIIEVCNDEWLLTVQLEVQQELLTYIAV